MSEIDLKAEVMEVRGVLVERLERAMEASALPFHPDFKHGCEACPMRGRNLACPPMSPMLPDYIAGRRRATVISYRTPMEQFGSGLIIEERYNEAYHMMQELLTEELLRYRQRGHVVAGSGPCRACPECALATGSAVCRTPERLIYSLESMGVSVVQLSELAFGIKLDWSGMEQDAEYVSAIGAAFA